MKRLLAVLLSITLIAGLFIGLAAEPVMADDVTPIYVVGDLYVIRGNMAGNYILMSDIDLSEATAPGGNYDFMGNGW